MRIQIASIVEGAGEDQAVPKLIQKIAAHTRPGLPVTTPPPLRIERSRIVKPGERERAVELSARRIGGQGAIVTILDADDDCPAQLGPQLLARARAARSDVRHSVVLANREFEAWFLASAESLRGECDLPATLQCHASPEMVRGAKEWLTKQMPRGRIYSPTVDQAALTARLDFAMARNAPSFDKLWRDVERLLSELSPV